MFDRICVRPSKGQQPGAIDLGLLAEAMLFYGEVDLVVNRGVLDQLLGVLGPADTVRLFENDALRLTHANKSTAILTHDTGGTDENHAVTVFQAPDLYLSPSAITASFRDVTGKSGRGRRLAERVARRINYWEPDDRLAATWTTELLSHQSVTGELRIVLAGVAPDYPIPEPLRFDVQRVSDSPVDGSPRLAVETNLDFVAIERVMTAVGAIKPLTIAHLLSWMASAREDLLFASHFSAELAVDPMTSRLVSRLVTDAMSGRERSSAAIEVFQEFTLGDARAVREAINSGARSLTDMLPVLERGRRFREWLDDRPADADLAKEYFQACTRSTWIERLPARMIRWLMVTGGGAAAGSLLAPGPGTVIGAGLGTADFVASAIASGWKPNQFVERELQNLARVDDDGGS